eukprot:Pgem_evm1s8636
MEPLNATPITKTETKRIIYFRGFKHEKNSVLITKVCNDFETFSALPIGESASRTLWNLYNLHAVRGCLIEDKLDFLSSMSGPHHYFGWISPRDYHIITPEN